MSKVLIFLARLIGFHFIPKNYKAAVMRFGMYHRARGPGFVWVAPFIERVESLVKMGMRFATFPVKQVLSNDSIPFDFVLTVFYSFDPYSSSSRLIADQMVRLPDHVLESIVREYADKSLRRVVARYRSDDILKWGTIVDIEQSVIEGLQAQVRHLGLAPMASGGVMVKEITPPEDFFGAIMSAKRLAIMANTVEKTREDFEITLTANGTVTMKRRARRLAALRREDPYIVGPPIESPEAFYGRQEILADLLQALRAGNHVALYGERRIGKTSLLHQLAHRLREMGDTPEAHLYLPVFLSLQMVPEARFFYALMRAIAGVARPHLHDRGQTLPSLLADERSAGYDSLDMADDLERVLESLQEVTDRPVRFVLLLDEADKMNGYDPHTQEGLRGLLMTPLGRQVKLVWSGQTMNREWHLETSPWFNLFKHEFSLSGLEEGAAVRLIRQPVKGVFTYDDEAVTRILHYSDRQPYAIQRLCSLCVRQLLAKDRFRVTVEDVEAAWRAMQDEDARHAAEETARQVTYAPHAPVQSLAEDQGEYKADESHPEEEE